MKSKHPSTDSGFSDRDDEALWDLLGKASSVEPKPMFARNVVREVRLEMPETTHHLQVMEVELMKIAYLK